MPFANSESSYDHMNGFGAIMEHLKAEGEAQAKRRLVRYLKAVGEECVAEAIDGGNYTDQTGNLRSSIGFVVADNGNVIEEGGFRSLGGSEGPNIGRAKALTEAEGTTGIALIVVAGMSYARYVADKGYNVLDSTEILARQLLSQIKA